MVVKYVGFFLRENPLLLRCMGLFVSFLMTTGKKIFMQCQ